jgi:hypothetical protein
VKAKIPAAHRAILDERLAAYRSGKSQLISHEELMRRLREKPLENLAPAVVRTSRRGGLEA